MTRRLLIDAWCVANVLVSLALVVYPAAAVWAAAVWVDDADHLVFPQVATWVTVLVLTVVSWFAWDAADVNHQRNEIVRRNAEDGWARARVEQGRKR